MQLALDPEMTPLRIYPSVAPARIRMTQVQGPNDASTPQRCWERQKVGKTHISTDKALVQPTLGDAGKLEGKSVLWTLAGKVSKRVHYMSKARCALLFHMAF